MDFKTLGPEGTNNPKLLWTPIDEGLAVNKRFNKSWKDWQHPNGQDMYNPELATFNDDKVTPFADELRSLLGMSA